MDASNLPLAQYWAAQIANQQTALQRSGLMDLLQPSVDAHIFNYYHMGREYELGNISNRALDALKRKYRAELDDDVMVVPVPNQQKSMERVVINITPSMQRPDFYYLSPTAPVLGSGSYAKAVEIYRLSPEKGKASTRALKISQPSARKLNRATETGSDIQELYKKAKTNCSHEAQNLRRIHSQGYVPGLIPPPEVTVEEPRHFLSFMKIYSGSLCQLGPEVTQSELLAGFARCAAGLAHLHQHDMVLGDIKMENVLVKIRDAQIADQKGRVRMDLCDIGDLTDMSSYEGALSKIYHCSGTHTRHYLTQDDSELLDRLSNEVKQRVTTQERRLEIVDQARAVYKARDCLALCITFFGGLTGKFPLAEDPDSKLQIALTEDASFEIQRALLKEKGISDTLVNLFRMCLQSDYELRYTAEQIHALVLEEVADEQAITTS